MLNRKIYSFFNTDRIVLIGFVALKMILSLLPISYGLFRDEFYYLSMSRHLGLGYVDVPPLAPFILAGVRSLCGDSQFALHIVPALTGALFLYIAYLLVKKLGGNRFALFLTLAAVTFAPYYIAIDSVYTYDTFNKLCWLGFSYLMIRLIQTEDPKYWIYIGIVAGVGLLCKITILFLAFGWVVGLMLTPQRKLLFRREVFWGAGLALLIASPYLLWQYQHGFITLEYNRNYSGKISDFSLVGYLTEQIVMMNPVTLPIWLGGLIYLLVHSKGKLLRPAGLTYPVLLIVSYLLKAKPDFILSYYVILIAAGIVWLSCFPGRSGWGWLRIAVPGLVILSGMVVLPVARPVLPVATFIRIYAGTTTKNNVERLALAKLPQFYADRFGWEEMAQNVATAYYSLPKTERAEACIIASNYGEAGAIEFYGERLGLPLPPLSGHNQYHVWGPGRFNGEIAIAVGFSGDQLARYYQDIRPVAFMTNPYMMPYEKVNPIYICRKPVKPFRQYDSWLKWLN